MADLRWIAVALVIHAFIQGLAVVRWQVLLRIQGVFVSWKRLSSLVMIGLFFNPFMPGGVGGDVVKIFYVLKEVGEKKSAALLAAVMDRIMGLLGLIAIAAVVIGLRYSYLTQTKVASGLLFVLLFIFAGTFAFIGVTFAINALGWVHKLPARLPMRARIVELSEAYTAYGKAWRGTLAALAISVPVHIASFALFYGVYRAFPSEGVTVSILDFCSMMPIINTLSAIPISIGGAGVREGLFINLLGDLGGIPAATAVVVSLTGFGVQLFWSLIGGVVYLFYRPSSTVEAASPDAPPADVKGEVLPG